MAYPQPHFGGGPGPGLSQAMGNLNLANNERQSAQQTYPEQYQQQYQPQYQQPNQQYQQPNQQYQQPNQQYQQPNQQYQQPSQQYQQPNQPSQQYQQSQQQYQQPYQQQQQQQQQVQQSGPVPSWVVPCDPINLAASVGLIPPNPHMHSNSSIPLAATVRPLAEGTQPPVIVNFAASGVVRCRPCRAYINPYVTFFDGGMKWKCNLCGKPNDVGTSYFSKLDSNGLRQDIHERPELTNASIEIIAPQEYTVRQPMPPVYMFVIDVSVNSVRSGFVKEIAESVRACLDELPGGPRTQVAFITFDSTVHFYGLNPDASSPQMFAISDLNDIFLPQPNHLLVTLEQAREHVETLLDSLAGGMHGGTEDVESALGPALDAAGKLMAPIGGKMLVFLSALPCLGAGKLSNRENPQIMGTDKEHTLLLPVHDHYKQVALKLSQVQVGINLYVAANSFTDIATIGDIATFSGGEIHYFRGGLNAFDNAAKLRSQLRRDLTRMSGWEAVVRTRVSKGLDFVSYSGHFCMRGNDLLGLPIVDSDKTITVEMKLDETGVESQAVCIQSALLYTTSTGERRIRVHNLLLPVAQNPAQVLSSVNLPIVTAIISKRAAFTALDKGLAPAREYINRVCTDMLRAIKQFSTSRELWQFPLLALAMIKSPAFRQSTEFLSPDLRVSILSWVRLLGGDDLITYFKPNLYELVEKSEEFAQPVALTSTSLKNDAVFLLDDGFDILLRVGRDVPPHILQDLFGANRLSEAKVLREAAANEPTSLAARLASLCSYLRQLGPLRQTLRILRQGEPAELEFLQRLVEDRIGNAMSLGEFLTNLGMQGGPPQAHAQLPQQPAQPRPQQYQPQQLPNNQNSLPPVHMHLPSNPAPALPQAGYQPSFPSPANGYAASAGVQPGIARPMPLPSLPTNPSPAFANSNPSPAFANSATKTPYGAPSAYPPVSQAALPAGSLARPPAAFPGHPMR